MTEKNTTIRVYESDLPRIEAIKRRLTKIDGKPRTTAQVIHRLIMGFWDYLVDDATLDAIKQEGAGDGKNTEGTNL